MSVQVKNKHEAFLKTVFMEKRIFTLLSGDVEDLSQAIEQEAKSQGFIIIECDFSEMALFFPYAPWFSLVLEKIKKTPPSTRQKTYQEAKIYHVLQQLLESTLADGIPSRNEPLIEEEVLYEISEIIKGIWLLFLRLYLQPTPTVILLKHLQQAPVSSLQFLRFLADQKPRSLHIYAFYGTQTEGFSEDMMQFIEWCQEKNLVFDLRTIENLESLSEEKISFNSVSLPIGKEVVKLQYIFLLYNAMTDAYQLGKKVVENEAFASWGEEEKLHLHWQTGRAASALKEFHEAAVHLNTAFALMQKKRASWSELSLLYRDIAYVFFIKDSMKDAIEVLDKALHFHEEELDKKTYFHLFFLYFQIEDKNRKQQPRPWKQIYDKIITLGTELHYENHLALIYINPYGIYSEYTSDVDKYNTLLLNEKGIALAKKLHNTYRLSHGYQIRGLIYAVMGQYDEVIKWYRRSLVLKKRMGLSLEIAYAYNGIGFYYYMTGRYAQAHEYYTKALQYLLFLKDFHEVAMTYFNMGMNCLLALDYIHAATFFEEVLKLIEILEIHGLAYHSLFGIYAVLGTTYALLGRWTQAYDCINQIRVKRLLPYLEKNEEYFFVALLLGLVAYYEKRIEEMIQRFREANYYLYRTNDNIGYMISWYCLVSAQLYDVMGRDDLFTQTWRNGKRHSEMQDYPFYKGLFSRQKEPMYTPAFSLEMTLSFTHVRDLAKAEHRISQIYREMQDIHVLNILQQEFIEKNNTKELVESTLTKLVQHFLIDFACFFEYRHKKWQLIFHAGENIEYIQKEEYVQMLSQFTQEKLWRAEEKDHGNWKIIPELSSLVYIPLAWEKHKGMLLCGTLQNQTLLTREDLRVLKLIGQQMGASFQRLVYLREIESQKKQLEQAYKQLQQMATHDVLTGVMNRMALKNRLQEEMARLKRYGKSQKNCFSLVLFDMDNFKRINDSYGYAEGDKVLTRSAYYMKRILRKVDLIFRYGGDEFMILLPETWGKQAQALTARIQNTIPQQVAKELSMKILPTFSAGITEYLGAEDTTEEQLLQKADQALFEAKNQGENCYVFKA